jgi:hypothetical protein
MAVPDRLMLSMQKHPWVPLLSLAMVMNASLSSFLGLTSSTSFSSLLACPSTLLSSFCLQFFPDCMFVSKTKTGHPNGWKWSRFGLTGDLLNNSIGDFMSGQVVVCALLKTSFAVLSAYGHRQASIAVGHRCWA